MTAPYPFSDDHAGQDADLALVRQARGGRRDALEALVERHQAWIYNIVRRMTYNPADAEDATQEILIKVITRLSSFEERSTFRTWLYRIVVNHVLNMKRGRSESHELTFSKLATSLEETRDAELPDRRSVPADVQLLVEEAKTMCTSAMLLCLDREQRLVVILGEVLGVSSPVGAELLEISSDSFRQKLSRARKELYGFLHGACGLVDQANPCRCEKKTQGFMDAGYVNPQKLQFVTERLTLVRKEAGRTLETLNAIDERCGAIYRDHIIQSPDFVASLRGLIASQEFRSVIDRREPRSAT